MAGVRHCVIRVDGDSSNELYDDLIAVEVGERVGEPSSFALQVGIFKQRTGGWTRLDETTTSAGGFSPWQRITIAAGFDSQPDVLIDGYVAGVAPRFEPVEADSYLLVWGYDASYAMDLDEKVREWPDKKYSDIASELFQAHGIAAGEVVDTQVLQGRDNELLIQRGTDWQFLKNLARRVGFDVFVRGGKGYFRPSELSRTPQKDLTVHFGQTATNVIWFEPRVVGDLPTKITMARPNAVTKKIEKVEVTTSPLRALGGRDSDALRGGRRVTPQPTALAPPDPVVSEQAMEALATGIRRRNDWIVTGEGEIDGMIYGRALRADGVVLIKGAGRTFSGRYYVTDVTHRITPDGYTQRFKVTRNGLDVQGDEPFQPVDADPSALAGNDERVTVRSGGPEVAP
jgi:phage protein D